MEDESSVTPSIIDEIHSWDIQGDQNGGESGANRSIIDDLHFSDIQQGKMEGEVVLLEVSLINFILRIWSNGKRKWCYSKYS